MARALQEVHGDEGFVDHMGLYSGDDYYAHPNINVMHLIQWVSSDKDTLNRELMQKIRTYEITDRSLKRASWSPSDFKLEELSIWPRLQSFYAACNDHLFALIDRHANI